MNLQQPQPYPQPLTNPNPSPRILKIAAISDTHGNNTELQTVISKNLSGDIFIHAGDFTAYNKRSHFQQFITLLKQLNFKHKLVIPGNHQILLDCSIAEHERKHFGIFHVFQDMERQKQIQRLEQIGVLYVEHDFVEIQGVKIFASAYTVVPPYWCTAFQVSEEKMREIWGGVPQDIDILVTHGPAFQVLDKTIKAQHVGSKEIKEYLGKTKAKLHFFGHIHQAKGKTTFKDVQCFNVAERLTVVQLKL